MPKSLHAPLLFIEEKSSDIPKIEAQAYFYTKTSNNTNSKDNEREKSVKEEEGPKLKFDTLDIEDKFLHLERLLATIPQMNCEFITADQEVVGQIKDMDDRAVRIKPKNEQAVTILKESVKDIRLKGL